MEQEYRGLLHSALRAAAAGTSALLVVEKAVLGTIDVTTLGATMAVLDILASALILAQLVATDGAGDSEIQS